MAAAVRLTAYARWLVDEAALADAGCGGRCSGRSPAETASRLQESNVPCCRLAGRPLARPHRISLRHDACLSVTEGRMEPTQAIDVDETDEVLAKRAGRGCLASFETIVRRHEQRVYRTALRILGDHHAAEDISQDTFLRANLALGSFRGSSTLGTWLCQIAVNAARTRKRTDERRRVVRLEEQSIADPSWGADVLIERQRLARVAIEVLGGLRERQRIAFILCDLEGVVSAEAAEQLRTSNSAVRQLACRARSALRACLPGIGPDPHKAVRETSPATSRERPRAVPHPRLSYRRGSK